MGLSLRKFSDGRTFGLSGFAHWPNISRTVETRATTSGQWRQTALQVDTGGFAPSAYFIDAGRAEGGARQNTSARTEAETRSKQNQKSNENPRKTAADESAKATKTGEDIYKTLPIPNHAIAETNSYAGMSSPDPNVGHVGGPGGGDVAIGPVWALAVIGKRASQVASWVGSGSWR